MAGTGLLKSVAAVGDKVVNFETSLVPSGKKIVVIENVPLTEDFPLICGFPRWMSVETQLQVVLWQQQFCSADRWAFRMSTVPKLVAPPGYFHSQLLPTAPC